MHGIPNDCFEKDIANATPFLLRDHLQRGQSDHAGGNAKSEVDAKPNCRGGTYALE